MPAKRQCGPQCGAPDRTHAISLKNIGKSEVLALTALCSASALKNANGNNGLRVARVRTALRASRLRRRAGGARLGYEVVQ